MKLKLSQQKGVEVVAAAGPIRPHDTRVLRAGLSKILRTGKNKIVLEFEGSLELTSDVIREIAAFDGLARELSGRIVVAGASPDLKTKIQSFATPPVILCFDTTEKAVEFLSAPPKPELPTAIPTAHLGEIETLKKETHSLGSRIKFLEAENKQLKEQVVLATLERKPPANEQEYIERIQFLEAKLESLMTEGPMGGAAAPAKKL